MNEKTFLVIVDDLFFSSKIGETIRHLDGTPIFAAEISELPEDMNKQSFVRIIVDLDLSRMDPINAISHLRMIGTATEVPMIAYGRHTKPESFGLARNAACDQAIPRSEFVRRLPEFIQTCMRMAGTKT